MKRLNDRIENTEIKCPECGLKNMLSNAKAFRVVEHLNNIQYNIIKEN